jgi:hypothetical protein
LPGHHPNQDIVGEHGDFIGDMFVTSSPFKAEPEDRENRMIHVFLYIMDNYLKIDIVEASERSKIHDLISFLKDDPSREYRHHVKDHGPFITYNTVSGSIRKRWLMTSDY